MISYCSTNRIVSLLNHIPFVFTCLHEQFSYRMSMAKKEKDQYMTSK